jgi:hypothetical protein
MSAIALETPLELLLPPRAALRPLADPAYLHDAETPVEEIQPWELHSELVLVSPELRRRSLKLLPDASDVLVRRPRRPLAAVAPAPEPTPEPEVREIGVLRYTAHRVAEVIRFGLAIVGAIFTLAMIAEALPH